MLFFFLSFFFFLVVVGGGGGLQTSATVWTHRHSYLGPPSVSPSLREFAVCVCLSLAVRFHHLPDQLRPSDTPSSGTAETLGECGVKTLGECGIKTLGECGINTLGECGIKTTLGECGVTSTHRLTCVASRWGVYRTTYATCLSWRIHWPTVVWSTAPYCCLIHCTLLRQM